MSLDTSTLYIMVFVISAFGRVLYGQNMGCLDTHKRNNMHKFVEISRSVLNYVCIRNSIHRLFNKISNFSKALVSKTLQIINNIYASIVS